MRSMVALFLTVLIAYALLCGVMFAFQRRLIYHPETQIAAPGDYGLTGFEDTRTTTDDGLSIQLWYHPAAKGFPTILYCHGNAGNVSDRAPIFAALASKGFGVLAVSYRGYGKSEGAPSEQGLYHDARAAFAFLAAKHIPVSRTMLYGESLGTGVAVQMATEYPVAALILQAPYTSVAQRAAELYYYVPVKLMIQDRFDSLSKIARVKAPLLLFHGEHDQVIPIWQGRALFAAAGADKQAFYFPNGAHNDFDSAVVSAHVLDFAKEHRLID